MLLTLEDSLWGPSVEENLTHDGVTTYTYTSAALSACHEWPNADGLRVAQDLSGTATTFVWDWATPVPELVLSVVEGKENVYLVGLDTLGWWDGEAWTFALPDALGSVRQTTDITGSVTANREWTPFGVEIDGAQAGLGYTGEWWDDSAGLLYLRARWYQPQTGRFTSRDLWPGNPEEPSTLLLDHVYVVNNPVMYIDPTGYMPDDPWDNRTINGKYNLVIIDPNLYDVILLGLEQVPQLEDDLSRVGMLKVNYQNDFGTLGRMVRGSPSDAMIIYNAPVAILVDRPGGTSEPYAAASWDNISELDLLARIMAAEATALGPLAAQDSEMTSIGQVALVRVCMTGYPDNLPSVLLGDYQFAFTLYGDQIEAAREAARRWSDPLEPSAQRARYERALAIAVGVKRRWLWDQRTIGMRGFYGTGRTHFRLEIGDEAIKPLLEYPRRPNLLIE
jgi:RHS repeat-associated protein